jgi:glutaredoxin 3
VSAAVTMYTNSWCPYCARARALLSSKGVAVADIDIEANPSRRDEMTNRSGRYTVPQIFIGELHVGGFDDLQTLDAAGDLDPLLRGTT